MHIRIMNERVALPSVRFTYYNIIFYVREAEVGRALATSCPDRPTDGIVCIVVPSVYMRRIHT